MRQLLMRCPGAPARQTSWRQPVQWDAFARILTCRRSTCEKSLIILPDSMTLQPTDAARGGKQPARRVGAHPAALFGGRLQEHRDDEYCTVCVLPWWH